MSEETKKSLRFSGNSPLLNLPTTISADRNDVIQYGVGFDVHRDKISVCVAAQLVTGAVLEVKSHTFSAMPQGVDEIVRFLGKYSPISCYLMEFTGVYHLPLYHALRHTFPDRLERIVAMNPLLLNRRITDLGKKTDRVDARSLAFLTFYQSLIKPSYIGSMQFFRTRDMIRSYHKTNAHCTACKNRIHRLLHSINAKMSLDLNAEWCVLLLDRFACCTGTISEIYEELISERKLKGLSVGVLEKQRPNIMLIGEITLLKEDRFMLRMELGRLLQEQLGAASFLTHAEQYMIDDPAYLLAYRNLKLIPGLGSLAVLTVLLEIGDYSRFGNWKAFAKYCGTVPIIDQSGNHKKKGHINRFSNGLLRYVLTQSAGVLINRCDKSTDLGEYAFKQHKIKHLPFKKASMKVANKLAKTIYNVLILGVDYNPSYEGYERRKKKQDNYLKKKKTLLESYRTRSLRRDINQFITSNYEFMNSSSRFQVTSGFTKMIKRAKYLNSDKDLTLKKK